MFKEAGSLGSLSMQLVYYRGPVGLGGECKASSWLDNPTKLTSLMSKITCQAGHTQIRKVLDHTLREGSQRRVNALLFVGDACEENPDHLVQKAAQLKALSIPAFMFQEGSDPDTQRCLQEIARATNGAYHRFDQGSVSQLAELLRAVVAFSVGGLAALEKQNSSAARKLLAQVRSQ